jgi:hypothetical protein
MDYFGGLKVIPRSNSMFQGSEGEYVSDSLSSSVSFHAQIPFPDVDEACTRMESLIEKIESCKLSIAGKIGCIFTLIGLFYWLYCSVQKSSFAKKLQDVFIQMPKIEILTPKASTAVEDNDPAISDLAAIGGPTQDSDLGKLKDRIVRINAVVQGLKK